MRTKTQAIATTVSKSTSLFLAIMLMLPIPQGFSSLDTGLMDMTDSSQPVKEVPSKPSDEITVEEPAPVDSEGPAKEGPLTVVSSDEQDMEEVILTMLTNVSNEIADAET